MASTTVVLVKTIPSSSLLYTGGGATTITLLASDITGNIDKRLIKVNIPRTKNKQNTDNTDIQKATVVDLQRIEDTIVIRGWLEDDNTETAWNKLWKLRAMQTRGGQLTSVTIANVVFNDTTLPAHIEKLTWTLKSDDTSEINVAQASGTARIEVNITLYLGADR